MNELMQTSEFDGKTYVPGRDKKRLTGQLLRVFDFMKGGDWFLIEEIARGTGDPQTSVTARMGDFRKPKFGGHAVEREYIKNGLHKYRLILNEEETA